MDLFIFLMLFISLYILFSHLRMLECSKPEGILYKSLEGKLQWQKPCKANELFTESTEAATP